MAYTDYKSQGLPNSNTYSDGATHWRIRAGQPIFGYNYGAKKYDRVRDTYKLVLNTTLVVGIITTLIFEIYPEAIIAIFLPYLLEKSKVGTGINGILYAAPIADLVALIVILGLTVPFFSKLKK